MSDRDLKIKEHQEFLDGVLGKVTAMGHVGSNVYVVSDVPAFIPYDFVVENSIYVGQECPFGIIQKHEAYAGLSIFYVTNFFAKKQVCVLEVRQLIDLETGLRP